MPAFLFKIATHHGSFETNPAHLIADFTKVFASRFSRISWSVFFGGYSLIFWSIAAAHEWLARPFVLWMAFAILKQLGLLAIFSVRRENMLSRGNPHRRVARTLFGNGKPHFFHCFFQCFYRLVLASFLFSHVQALERIQRSINSLLNMLLCQKNRIVFCQALLLQRL